MPPPERFGFSAIILAAQRGGQVDPLARGAGVSHKCLVPIAGRPLIAHVVDAIGGDPRVSRVRICVEASAFGKVRSALPPIPGCAIDFVLAAENLADSVHGAARSLTGNILITTADNVLLTPSAIQAVLAALDQGAEAVATLTTRERVLAAHPDGQRRFYRFADGEYSNCNLYGLSGQGARRAAEAFRTGGQFAKNPLRIARAFGLVNLLLFRFAMLSIHGAMRRLSKRFRVRMQAVVVEDGALAIDVDNARTFAIAEQLLLERQPRRSEQKTTPVRRRPPRLVARAD